MSRRNQILGVGLLIAAAVSAPKTAAAQPAQTSAPAVGDIPACNKTPDPDEAKKKYIAARQDYEEGNYDTALKRFKDAYALDCKPELLLLISSTYERKGDKQQALNALEVYVQRAPKDAPDMTTTQSKIENLKKQIAMAQPPPPPPPQPPPKTEQDEHTIYPWIVTGAGVVALGIGIAVVATAPNLPSNCEKEGEKCTMREGQSGDDFRADQEQAGRAKDQPFWGIVTIAGGGALIAGGIIWHFLEPTGPKDKARLTPMVAPGLAGLSFGGRF